jgi:hypothetical protein
VAFALLRRQCKSSARNVYVMQRWRIAFGVALGAAGFAVALSSNVERASWAAPKARSPLLGIVGTWSDPRLVRLDPRSLRPLGGPQLEILDAVRTWAFSPDRSRLALGTACQAADLGPGTLQLVDVRRIRAVGCLAIGFVQALAWPTPDRLLVVANAEAILIDPIAVLRVGLDTLAITVLHRSPGQRGQRRGSPETRRALWVGRGIIASFGVDEIAAGRRVIERPRRLDRDCACRRL